MKDRGTNQTVIGRQLFFGAALSACLFFASPMTRAQTAPDNSQSPNGQQQDQNQNAAPDQSSDDPTGQKTFTGVIARSGDKYVLTDPLSKTSYQLDDQRKAQEMANKNVKVTGVLDPSTGTIRVTAIEPL
jgi:hypothetical protein